jgi:hypothetical protein
MTVDKLINEKQKEEKHLNQIKKKCDEKEIFNNELMKNQLELKNEIGQLKQLIGKQNEVR